VALVALLVQVYSTAYLAGPGTRAEPTRYRAYAATVSLFTAAMMLVVHADDLILLLIGWEVMGACSYLLVGHHSERDSARRAAVKAFLVTRLGDLGVLLAIVVLLTQTHTTSISRLLQQADKIPATTSTLVALLLLAGVVGKSAQFPLHTWLPDAMEGPTPVSALIHAATMVAAGVYLVARLLPLFLAAPRALHLAAVLASITMFGAALSALAQTDLKRLLAWSTISQVAYMLGGVAVARTEADAGPAVLHLLSHAGFKAMLFLLAGCVTHLVGSTSMTRMSGLWYSHRRLAILLGLGLAALAGIFPLSGFWSKEAVLSAAEHSATHGGGWTAWLVLLSGLGGTALTGAYATRAFVLVCLGEPDPKAAEHSLPPAMTWVLYVLAVPTVGLGLVLLAPIGLFSEVRISYLTVFLSTGLALLGAAWAVGHRLGLRRDAADQIPAPVRAFLIDGYRLDQVQYWLAVRPVLWLAKLVGGADRDVIDSYPRATVRLVRWGGLALRRAQTGLVSGYLAWLVAGTAILGYWAVSR
jgi:NADH-quinone oxidoreductase subunit L